MTRHRLLMGDFILMPVVAVLATAGCTEIASTTSTPLEQVIEDGPWIEGEVVTKKIQFDLASNSTSPQSLRIIAKSCNCATARLTGEAISRDQPVKLDMSIDMTGKKGPVSVFCTVRDSAGVSRQCIYKTKILSAIASEPATINLVGKIDEPEITKEITLIVQTREKTAPTVEWRLPESGFGALSISPVERIAELGPPGLSSGIFSHRMQFSVLFAPKSIPGNQAIEIPLKVISGKHEKDFHFNCYLTSNYSANPDSLFTQIERNSVPVTREVEIVRGDGLPFTIDSDIKCEVEQVLATTVDGDSPASTKKISIAISCKDNTSHWFGNVRVNLICNETRESILIPMGFTVSKP